MLSQGEGQRFGEMEGGGAIKSTWPEEHIRALCIRRINLPGVHKMDGRGGRRDGSCSFHASPSVFLVDPWQADR